MKKIDGEEHESPLVFPCDFPIKIMGRADLDFQAAMLAIVRKHVPTLGEAAVDLRYSKEGKYLSLTVMIQATSREQLDAIYNELSSDDRVMMLL